MDANLKKTIGQRLQLLRNERNLTQEQMGELLSLSTSAYCKIEYGETDLTLTRLNKIAQIFQMKPIELFHHLDGKSCNDTIRDNKLYKGHCHLVVNDDLREIVKANCRIIDMLVNRVDALERLVVSSK